MAGIRVRITDPTGTDTHEAELPHDVEMRRLLPALLTRLNYPVTGPDGAPISYRLYYDGRQILEEETLEQAHVATDATLSLSQEATAGGAV